MLRKLINLLDAWCTRYENRQRAKSKAKGDKTIAKLRKLGIDAHWQTDFFGNVNPEYTTLHIDKESVENFIKQRRNKHVRGY